MGDIIVHDIASKRRAADFIAALDVEKPWVVTVKRKVKKHSDSQRGLYFKWVGIIANHTGDDKDDTHDALKEKFLDPVERTVFGELRMIRSIKGLPAKEMSVYMDRVMAFAGSFLGVMLPVPEEMHRR